MVGAEKQGCPFVTHSVKHPWAHPRARERTTPMIVWEAAAASLHEVTGRLRKFRDGDRAGAVRCGRKGRRAPLQVGVSQVHIFIYIYG